MSKQKQYEIEKNLEYGSIEHQHVDPKARAKFKAKAFEPMRLPRHDVIGYVKAKGHDVKGEMSSGGS